MSGLLATADFNGDGKPDLFVADYCHGVSVRLNTTASGGSAASFADQQAIVPSGFVVDPDHYVCGAPNYTSADLDGDGRPDLIASFDGESGFPENPPGCIGGTFVATNTTAPGALTASFDPPQYFGGAVALIAMDANSDGRPDLIGPSGRGWSGWSVDAQALAAILLNTTNLDLNLVELDQHGITGSWFNPATGGQGFEIEAYPDAWDDGQGALFAGWFTMTMQRRTSLVWPHRHCRTRRRVCFSRDLHQEGGNLNAAPSLSAQSPLCGSAAAH